jgi:hypothetical protein
VTTIVPASIASMYYLQVIPNGFVAGLLIINLIKALKVPTQYYYHTGTHAYLLVIPNNCALTVKLYWIQFYRYSGTSANLATAASAPVAVQLF